jgi:hypothetical protein
LQNVINYLESFGECIMNLLAVVTALAAGGSISLKADVSAGPEIGYVSPETGVARLLKDLSFNCRQRLIKSETSLSLLRPTLSPGKYSYMVVYNWRHGFCYIKYSVMSYMADSSFKQ